MAQASTRAPDAILTPPPGRVATGWDPLLSGQSIARLLKCITSPCVLGYTALGICVLVYSTLAPDLDLLVGVPPATRVVWRATSASLAFAATILVSDYLPRLWSRPAAALEPQAASTGYDTMTTRTAVAYACLASICFSMWAGVYVTSLAFTSPGQATLFGNVQGMFLVALRLLGGKPVSVLEVVGCLIAVGGAALVSQDPSGVTVGAPPPTVLGNMIALASSLGATLYILTAQTAIHKLGTLRFMLIVQIGTTLIAMVAALVLGEFDARSFIEPLNTANGVLGWLAPEEDRLGAIMYCGFVVGLLGMGLFAYSLSAISGAVVGGSMLLTPALTMAVAVAMHMSAPPGLFTYLGTATLIGGLLMVIWGESLRDGLAAVAKGKPMPSTVADAGSTGAAAPTFMQRVCGRSINACCTRGQPRRRLSRSSNSSAESQQYVKLPQGPKAARDSVV